nr:unnamed protein product [Digitaria exilis]
MFGFSRRRAKLGRLKGGQSDPLNSSRSPADPSKQLSLPNRGDAATTSVSGRADDLSYRCSSDTFDLDGRSFNISENWTVLSTEGDKPIPRFYHAAAIVNSKMVVFGGDSGHHLLDDTKVPWGNSVILVGGKTEPASDRLSVWIFNAETELWSLLEAKGDIPAARSGHTVIRAGATLILFGGEDTKGKKRHDLHMFDLKSSTWLQLNYKGAGPSPRSNHVAALYDDRILLIFGGHSKSKTLNDLYSLDFETMVWSRVKTHGHHPSPRAGCSGALCGTKWYIAGGASKKKRHVETWVFDILDSKWSVCVVPPSSSITSKKGFSMVPFYHRDKIALVAFGGNKKEPCNKIVLQPKGHRSTRAEAGIQSDMAQVETMVTGGSSVRRIARCASDVSQSHLYNTKVADLIRRNAVLEDRLATALASKDQLEKSLSSVIHSREQLEKMLANKDKEAEILKEKIASLELAQEESNSLSNTVHADNVRLEREVAFLKAVADETQKARELDIYW